MVRQKCFWKKKFIGSSNKFVEKYIMKQWVNVTNTFEESQRHYKNTYLEICEVLDETVEVSLFSSVDNSYEIYFSFGIMYGIVYAKEEDAYEKREQMKTDLEQEYRKNNEPSEGFINSFEKNIMSVYPMMFYLMKRHFLRHS